MILHCLVPALLLLTGVSTVASESFALQILDQWDNHCQNRNVVNRTSCSAITSGDCRDNVKCLRNALQNRLPQMSSADVDRLAYFAGVVEEKICEENPYSADYPEQPEYKTLDPFALAMNCAGSKKTDILNCLKDLSDLYCSWESKINNITKTIWSDDLNTLVFKTRSCVLQWVAQCSPGGTAAAATFTDLFLPFKDPEIQWFQESSSTSSACPARISPFHVLLVFFVFSTF